MATASTINKITKMLSLAFRNANMEEATTSFRMAKKKMEGEGVTYEQLFNVEIYEGAAPSQNSSQRETELVEKYNQLLQRAKQLKTDLEVAKSSGSSSADLLQVKAELENAHDQMNNQANEIIRLRAELHNKKYTLKNLAAWMAIGGVVAFFIGMSNSSTKTVYVDRPVPTTPPSPVPVPPTIPATDPVTPSGASNNEGEAVIDNLAKQAPVALPAAIKTWTLSYGAVNNKGAIIPLVITQYSDGTIKDNTGEVFNNPGGSTFYAENDYKFSINGKEFLTDNTPPAIAARFLPHQVREDLNKAIRNGCDVYMTSFDGKLINLAICKNLMFFNDVNNYGEVKKYTYDSINEIGEMKYIKNNSNKYITTKGINLFMNDRNANNVIYSFRGNTAFKLN